MSRTLKVTSRRLRWPEEKGRSGAPPGCSTGNALALGLDAVICNAVFSHAVTSTDRNQQ